MKNLSEVTIRPMAHTDLSQVIAVHMQSFPGFFLTFLGPDFLKLLYRNIMTAEDGIALVACRSDAIDGFVAGVMHQSGFYRQLVKQQRWTFARASLKAVLRRSSIVPRLWRALRRPADTQESAAEACLMSIAIRPEAAGHGMGQQLVVAFCQELARRGAPAVCLTTDRDQNERTNHFYQQLGFRVSSTFVTPEGRAMNEYVMDLPMKEYHA
jgi:ribosomal protein S18 acetylase RimI-like enzyme